MELTLLLAVCLAVLAVAAWAGWRWASLVRERLRIDAEQRYAAAQLHGMAAHAMLQMLHEARRSPAVQPPSHDAQP